LDKTRAVPVVLTALERTWTGWQRTVWNFKYFFVFYSLSLAEFV